MSATTAEVSRETGRSRASIRAAAQLLGLTARVVPPGDDTPLGEREWWTDAQVDSIWQSLRRERSV